MFNCILRSTGAGSEVISERFVRPIVIDNCEHFHDPCLSYSRGEIPPEAVRCGIYFRQCFRDNFRPEVVSAVMSGLAVEWFSMDVLVKLGDSRSNGSQDMGGALGLDMTEAYIT